MAMTLEEFLQTQSGQEMQTNILSLSDAERETFMLNLQQAADEGRLEDFNADQTILQSQLAEEARAEAESLQAAQAEAIAAGDFETAHELAIEAEYAIEEVEAHGGEVAYAEVIAASSDESQLDYAADAQESADSNAAYAMDLAAEGDLDGAAHYADTAADYAADATDFAASTDIATTTVEPTVDMSTSVDTSATSLAVDTADDV